MDGWNIEFYDYPVDTNKFGCKLWKELKPGYFEEKVIIVNIMADT